VYLIENDYHLHLKRDKIMLELPHLSTKTRKYLRYGLSGLLVTGMVLVTGFLSFTGALVLNDSIYFAIAAFFLAGGIEGEVFAQNISSSLIKIFTGNYLEDVILAKKLAQLTKGFDDKHPTSQFLTDYKRLLDYSADLAESHDEAHEQELKKTQRTLKWMRRHFKNFMLNEATSSEDPFHAELTKLVTPADKLALQKEIRKKIWLNRLSWVLNLGAGLSCCLVGLEVAQSSILAVAAHFGLAISGAALSASVFGLALLGAVGYTLLIHNTISNMIQNDTLQKWAKKTITFFSRKGYELSTHPEPEKNQIHFKKAGTTLEYTLKDPAGKIISGCLTEEELKAQKITLTNSSNPAELVELNLAALSKMISEKSKVACAPRESLGRYLGRTALGSLAVGIVVGLGVFATVATAGTWWYAAQAGAKMIPGIASFASEIRAGAVSIMGFTTLIFNVVNSLKSAKELAQISIRETWHQIKDNIQKHKNTENRLQFFNPIRILIKTISIPFKLVTFVGHLVSMGIMGDKLEGVNPNLTTGLNTSSEFLTDFHIIFPEDEHHHSESCPQASAEKNVVGKETPPSAKPHTHHHGHSHGHSHGYSHGHSHGHSHNKRKTVGHENAAKENQAHEHQHTHSHKHHHHDHTHTDLTGKFLKLALAPLFILSALWDYGFSDKDSQLTFKQALKKSFSGLPKKTHIEKPQLSRETLKLEKLGRIQKTLFKHGKDLYGPQAKAANLEELETIDKLRNQILAPVMPHEIERASYVNDNGTINSASFFSTHHLSQKAKLVCEKLIEKANSSPLSLTQGP
jgi:hypothetical protein